MAAARVVGDLLDTTRSSSAWRWTRCAVASVDYRRSRRSTVTGAVRRLDALLWREHRSRLGFATDRLAVGGDSAGATSPR